MNILTMIGRTDELFKEDIRNFEEKISPIISSGSF